MNEIGPDEACTTGHEDGPGHDFLEMKNAENYYTMGLDRLPMLLFRRKTHLVANNGNMVRSMQFNPPLKRCDLSLKVLK